MSRLTATEASRNFSETLSRVAAGEEVEVTRNGAPVAVIGPPKVQFVTAERFRALIASAPAPDEDFAGDLRELRSTVTSPQSPWPS